jgi:hypothetical protein
LKPLTLKEIAGFIIALPSSGGLRDRARRRSRAAPHLARKYLGAWRSSQGAQREFSTSPRQRSGSRAATDDFWTTSCSRMEQPPLVICTVVRLSCSVWLRDRPFWTRCCNNDESAGHCFRGRWRCLLVLAGLHQRVVFPYTDRKSGREPGHWRLVFRWSRDPLVHPSAGAQIGEPQIMVPKRVNTDL